MTTLPTPLKCGGDSSIYFINFFIIDDTLMRMELINNRAIKWYVHVDLAFS